MDAADGEKNSGVPDACSVFCGVSLWSVTPHAREESVAEEEEEDGPSRWALVVCVRGYDRSEAPWHGEEDEKDDEEEEEVVVVMVEEGGDVSFSSSSSWWASVVALLLRCEKEGPVDAFSRRRTLLVSPSFRRLPSVRGVVRDPCWTTCRVIVTPAVVSFCWLFFVFFRVLDIPSLPSHFSLPVLPGPSSPATPIVEVAGDERDRLPGAANKGDAQSEKGGGEEGDVPTPAASMPCPFLSACVASLFFSVADG